LVVTVKSASRSESVESPLLYRLPEAARLLGLSLAYLYLLKDAGKIRVRKVGRAARVHRDDLEAFAAGAPTAPLKYGSEPTGPLLGADQQRLAVERVSDPPKRRRRKAKTKTKSRPRRAPAPAPEPVALVDQQPPAVEHEPELPAVDEQQPTVEPDYAVVMAEHLRVIRGNYPDAEEPKLRAVEYAVRVYRDDHPNASIEDARAAVMAAVASGQLPSMPR
jgi:excisionase family DNA binding protein